MGRVIEAFVFVSAPSSCSLLPLPHRFPHRVLNFILMCLYRNRTICLCKTPEADSWCSHIYWQYQSFFSFFSLGVETIERELKMLEEVHKGTTSTPAPPPHMLRFAIHD
jgi:hypothetical protein